MRCLSLVKQYSTWMLSTVHVHKQCNIMMNRMNKWQNNEERMKCPNFSIAWDHLATHTAWQSISKI